MITLGEVINKVESAWVCPSSDEGSEYCDLMEVRDDALHYLKEFQGLSKMWNDKLDKEQENPPLDWETLKLMKGKPVWVEADEGKYKGWFIVGNFFSWFEKEDFDAHVNLYRSGGAMEMSKEMYGGYWQAYRTERSA